MSFRRPLFNLFVASIAVGPLMIVGCSSGDGDYQEVKPADIPVSDPHASAHNHPSEGPHHGILVELGAEEFHAEIVLPDASENAALTVYVLDSAAKEVVAIDSTEITINLSHDGNAEQFKLAASPDDGDADGKASRFSSSDAELVSHFRSDAVHGQLVLTINGTSYRGEIDHHAHGGSHQH
jgi:hypothetical protein